MYQLEDATDGTVIGIRSYLPETINPETVHVRGTIRDWTGRTIGLIAL